MADYDRFLQRSSNKLNFSGSRDSLGASPRLKKGVKSKQKARAGGFEDDDDEVNDRLSDS